ncbi:hypothetical protein F4604DRAFT_372853 [Suillus subluteus]|nr:hypothetical protein F4604DRAFT_372853 [Suillus subluteus]
MCMNSTILPYYPKSNNRYSSSLLADDPLLVQKGQVSWQPPVAHVQQSVRAHPALSTVIGQSLGADGVYCEPTIDLPAFAQYSASATFPPEDTTLVHTHAAYSNQRFTELVSHNCGNWTFALDVPTPDDMINPTLTSLSYTAKYSTANDHLPCTVRSNILLAKIESEGPEESIISDSDDISDISQTGEGATAVCLSSVLGIKANNLENQWNHFVDRQHIPLNVRIVQSSRLYLQVHISEYPTEATLRSLLMDVSATWLDDHEGRRLLQKRQEAKIRAVVAEAKAADGEEARKAAETKLAADQQAKEEAEAKQHAAEAQSAADATARQKAEDEAKQADTERKAAEEKAERDKVGRAADEKMQATIEQALSRLPADRKCPNGFAWTQTASGFKCGGGGHSISWEELDKLSGSK